MSLPSRRDFIPKIDKGVPPPKERPPRKRAEKKPSRWFEFLRGLEDGDSFLIPCFMASNIRTVAKRLGYESLQEVSNEPLVLQSGYNYTREFRACRIWIYKS